MTELYHYGVPGMKWGKRRAQPVISNGIAPKPKSPKGPTSGGIAPKKSAKTGKKKVNKVLQKAGNRTVKSVGNSAKLGFSMMQSLYNISDTGMQNRQMTTYLNTASQMSPEYRRRFMYD